MKKVAFFFGICLLGLTGIVAAGNTPYEPGPRCAVAGEGEVNNGVCYNTYGSNGQVNGSNCTAPGAGSTAVKNCIYN
jgi:hypothetical protein